MWLEQSLFFIQNSALARFLETGREFTIAAQIAHILGFTLLLALVLALTLRVQGWTLTALPLTRLSRALQRPYYLALTLALGAGLLLFLPRALAYGLKDIFAWKLLLLALAILAQALLQGRLRALDEAAPAPAALKGLAFLSLFLWFGSAAAGRAIGFV
ncbi:MAG: hypothetical protein LBE21_04030 [Pseudomonadales bacterium]|jgi:hypothetical protein|nr:hypothetical protein [Pseudomonadales bacterium]